ncbi:hypothetical protein BaRGS_00018728, partial [Batillaria attramentaria]
DIQMPYAYDWNRSIMPEYTIVKWVLISLWTVARSPGSFDRVCAHVPSSVCLTTTTRHLSPARALFVHLSTD